MTRSRSITYLAGAAALPLIALAVAGCGGSDNNSSGGGGSSKSSAPAASGGGNTVKLSETEFKIDPSKPSVKTGAVTFTATNNGQITHALEVQGPAEEKKTANIEPGKSATLKVDLSKPGSYVFYCPIDGHKQQGMKGEIKVGS